MNFSLNLSGRLLDLSEPRIMGILNITPDSFYTKGRDSDLDSALRLAEQMYADGASIIDIGGQSTRPGAKVVGAEEEIKRVVPVIEALIKRFPEMIISVDTYYAAVAKASVEAGALIINDISAGLLDEKMLPTISMLGVSYILMHMQGTPQIMQQNPQYGDVVVEVFDFLNQRVQLAREMGIKDIVIDLGFGFGKTISQNYSLLKHLRAFEMLQCPMLVGVSRKSMIYKALGIGPEDALNGTSILHAWALQAGAHLLRVHDVKAAVEAVQLYKMWYSAP
ncbi:MAG TPA: dihydropteroate synthase [Edaphocola sp.]|nr:dihydropteroate synthase [Edaphocola sp.]